MKKLLLLLVLVYIRHLHALDINENSFIDKSRCDKIIDKQIYKICYSYKYKSALGGWSTLNGDTVYKGDIKKRPRFYIEKNLPKKYRTKYSDYYDSMFDHGHFIASDADFDYDKKILRKTYTMANVVPMYHIINGDITLHDPDKEQWLGVEKYGRKMAKRLGYVHTVSLAAFGDENWKIKNGITVPTGFYRILYNNDRDFLECYYYKNTKVPDTFGLAAHKVSCQKLMR